MEYNELIDELENKRVENNITIKALAKQCDMQYANTYNILHHQNIPRLDTFLKMLSACGYTVQLIPKEKDATVRYYEQAAQESRTSKDQWFRYLRKFITAGGCTLSEEQINALLLSDQLSMYQRMTLKQALLPGSGTNQYIWSLNEKATPKMLEQIKRKQMVSKIESGKGVTMATIESYANTLGKDIILSPKVPKEFETSYLYLRYNELSQKQNIVFSHTAALEALGLFSGYSNEYLVEYYAVTDEKKENTLCHLVKSMKSIGSVYVKGIYCTDITRTLNDVLADSERIDDTVIIESLNTYYYENGKTFEGLLLSEKAKRSLDLYAEDAIYL